MFNILVTGDRLWKEYSIVYEALAKAWDDSKEKIQYHPLSSPNRKFSPRNILVIHGGSKGADTHAGQAAFRLGMGIRVYPANWLKYKKGAGPIRNALMLKENKVDLILAFHDDLTGSKGTRDMVKQALKAGIPIRLYKSNGNYSEITEIKNDTLATA